MLNPGRQPKMPEFPPRYRRFGSRTAILSGKITKTRRFFMEQMGTMWPSHNGKSGAAFSSLSPDTSFWFNHNNLSGKWINVRAFLFFSKNLCTSKNKNQNQSFSWHQIRVFGSLTTFSFSYFLSLWLGLVAPFLSENKIFEDREPAWSC